MPAHVVIAHLAVILAPAAALIALGASASLRGWRAMRWPLLLLSLAAATLVLWAGAVAKPLWSQVKATGTAAEVDAASAHAHGSDSLAVSAAALALLVLWCQWRLRARDTRAVDGPAATDPAGASTSRAPSSAASAGLVRAHLVSRALLAISALAVLVTTWTTLEAAMRAVWVGKA